jgi:hypothetical protein
VRPALREAWRKQAPPTLPQPQVVAELAKLEQSREANEGVCTFNMHFLIASLCAIWWLQEQMSALRLAYDEALAAAKVEIANVVGCILSELKGGDPTYHGINVCIVLVQGAWAKLLLEHLSYQFRGAKRKRISQ